jgi:hypothetical protein
MGFVRMAKKLAVLPEEEKEKRIKESQEKYNEKKPAITFRIDREAKEKLEGIADRENIPLGTLVYNAAMGIINAQKMMSEEREKIEAEKEKQIEEMNRLKNRIKNLFRYTIGLMILMPVVIYVFSITDSYQIIPIFSILIAVIICILFYVTLQSMQ